MKFITVLLSLVVACTAIDVVFFKGAHCVGEHEGFYNVEPNTCVHIDQPTEGGKSTGFYFLPREWNIEARGYYWSKCFGDTMQDTKRMYGRYISKFCMTGQPYRSAGYGFIDAWKMASGEGKMASGETNKECVKPNMRGLADGTRYNLTAMGDELAGRLMMLKNATRDTVPEVYKEYEMSKEFEMPREYDK